MDARPAHSPTSRWTPSPSAPASGIRNTWPKPSRSGRASHRASFADAAKSEEDASKSECSATPGRVQSSITMKRRTFLQNTLLGAAGAGLSRADAAKPAFQLNYLVGSAMYGDLPLATVIEETPKTGATHIDIWPRKHATQREQMDEMGHEKVMELLAKHGVKLAVSTRYNTGPFKLEDEIPVLKKFGGSVLVADGKGPSKLAGDDLKKAVREFVEKLK